MHYVRPCNKNPPGYYDISSASRSADFFRIRNAVVTKRLTQQLRSFSTSTLLGKMSPLTSFVEIVVICTIAQSAPGPEIIDLGYEVDNKTEFWPGSQKYVVTVETREKNINDIPW